MKRFHINGLLGAVALVVVALPALAAGITTVSSPTDGSALVRGGAPLAEVDLDFPTAPSPLDSLPLSSTGNLAIAVTSTDQGVLHFLFSPREEFGASVDRSTGTSRSFAGLNWNLFDQSGVFGNVGLAGSVTDAGITDPERRLLGPPLAMHGTVELGYHIGDQHSLSLSLDHASRLDLGNDRGALSDDFRLRYGYRF